MVPLVAVGVVRVEYELLVPVAVVVRNTSLSFRHAPAHGVPFVHRIADGSVRAFYDDLTGVVQIDVFILRDETVKVFQALAIFQHRRYAPVARGQTVISAHSFSSLADRTPPCKRYDAARS